MDKNRNIDLSNWTSRIDFGIAHDAHERYRISPRLFEMIQKPNWKFMRIIMIWYYAFYHAAAATTAANTVSGAGNEQTTFFFLVPTVFQSDLVLLATHCLPISLALSLTGAARFCCCCFLLMRFLFGGRCIITQTDTDCVGGAWSARVCVYV